jgi:hypothetical protein
MENVKTTSTPTSSTQPAPERGCGRREAGGVYVECNRAETGPPLSHFAVDPPQRFRIKAKRGQEFRKVEGTWHMFDWIGEAHYPTAADFYEEVLAHGLSRRTASQSRLSRLTPDSRIVLVHPRAKCLDAEKLRRVEMAAGLTSIPSYRHGCMRLRQSGGSDTSHFDCEPSETTPCTRFWWLDAGWHEPLDRPSPEEVEQGGGSDIDLPYRQEGGGLEVKGTREIGDTAFQTYGGPLSVSGAGETGPLGARFSAGIVLSLPISRLAVISASDQSHRKTFQDLQGRVRVPLSLKDS